MKTNTSLRLVNSKWGYRLVFSIKWLINFHKNFKLLWNVDKFKNLLVLDNILFFCREKVMLTREFVDICGANSS